MSDINTLQSIELVAAQPCINLNDFNTILESNNAIIDDCLDEINLTYLRCCRINANDPENRDIDFCYNNPITGSFLESSTNQVSNSTVGFPLQFLNAVTPNGNTGVYYSDFIAPYTSVEGCLIELTGELEICFSKTPFSRFSFLFELEVACEGAYENLATQGFSGAVVDTAGSVDCINYPINMIWYIERYQCINDILLRWRNPVISRAGANVKGLSLTFKDLCLKGACS
jgi:hypothetical protein